MLKRTISLLLCLCMVLAFIPLQASAAESIAIDETNFPDENFRAYLLEQDYGADSILTPEEIAEITELDVSELEIQDLTGVEYFTALEKLDCGDNELTVLDVTNNTALKNLNCYANHLTALDVSKNLALIKLDCDFNRIEKLDVSKNTALVKLDCYCNLLTELNITNNVALEKLDCGDNELTQLDVTKNPKLNDLSCAYNHLTVLNVTENTALTHLSCYGNQLTELDVSKNTALKYLWIYNNQLTELDISMNLDLVYLDCDENMLTELDLSKNSKLNYLSVVNNRLTNLDLSNQPELGNLVCEGNLYGVEVGEDKQLDLTMLPGKFDVTKASDWVGGTVEGNILTFTESIATYTYQISDDYSETFTIVSGKNVAIDETNFPDANFRSYLLEQDYGTDGVLDTMEVCSIEELDVSELEILDLTGIEHFIGLKYLYCNGNELTKLNVGSLTELEHLDCYENQLTELDVSTNTALTDLDCADNPLTDLNLCNNTELSYLRCCRNQLTKLDISKNSKLYQLFCYENQLTELDVSKCPVLTYLDCDDNKLAKLDVTKNTALEALSCSYNQLTELNVRDLANLETLRCYNNQLTELDVSNNLALTDLDCDDNKLAKLDVSKNTALESLRCSYNQLTELNVRNLANLEALRCYNNQLTQLDVSTNLSLAILDCEENELTILDVSKNTALESLTCSFNHLTALDLSNTLIGEDSFSCYENAYIVTLDSQRQFDLTTLPDCFDISKVSQWDTHPDGTVLTFRDHAVYYEYEVADGLYATFALKVDETCMDNDGDWCCDICGNWLIDRISGKNRYLTAIEIADSMTDGEKLNAIIIACGDNSADALSGSYLSTMTGAPILLSYGKNDQYAYLDQNNIDFIKENLAEDGIVYILGGTAAVPDSYEKALTDFEVKRLSGKNRFGTNLAILKEAGIAEGEEILVCTAYKFADSLSASATGKPILLVSNLNDILYGLDDEFLSSLEDCSFTIIGGTAAVGSEFVEKLEQYGEVNRLSGKTRYETSILVAETYFEEPDCVVVASAWNYPDGLCGGLLAYNMYAPLILTKDGDEDVAAAYTAKYGITHGIVLGGTGAIADKTIKNIILHK